MPPHLGTLQRSAMSTDVLPSEIQSDLILESSHPWTHTHFHKQIRFLKHKSSLWRWGQSGAVCRWSHMWAVKLNGVNYSRELVYCSRTQVSQHIIVCVFSSLDCNRLFAQQRVSLTLQIKSSIYVFKKRCSQSPLTTWSTEELAGDMRRCIFAGLISHNAHGFLSSCMSSCIFWQGS